MRDGWLLPSFSARSLICRYDNDHDQTAWNQGSSRNPAICWDRDESTSSMYYWPTGVARDCLRLLSTANVYLSFLPRPARPAVPPQRTSKESVASVWKTLKTNLTSARWSLKVSPSILRRAVNLLSAALPVRVQINRLQTGCGTYVKRTNDNLKSENRCQRVRRHVGQLRLCRLRAEGKSISTSPRNSPLKFKPRGHFIQVDGQFMVIRQTEYTQKFSILFQELPTI